jgi:hypothetical protein
METCGRSIRSTAGLQGAVKNKRFDCTPSLQVFDQYEVLYTDIESWWRAFKGCPDDRMPLVWLVSMAAPGFMAHLCPRVACLDEQCLYDESVLLNVNN